MSIRTGDSQTGNSQTPAPSRMHESSHHKKKSSLRLFLLHSLLHHQLPHPSLPHNESHGPVKKNKLTAPFLILTSRPGASHPPPPPAPALQSQLVRAARLARALCASAIATATASASAPAPIKCQGTSRRVLLGLLSSARSPSIPVRYETLYGVPNPSQIEPISADLISTFLCCLPLTTPGLVPSCGVGVATEGAEIANRADLYVEGPPVADGGTLNEDLLLGPPVAAHLNEVFGNTDPICH